MYNVYNGYTLPYYPNTPMYSLSNLYRSYNYPYYFDDIMYNQNNIYRGYAYPCYGNPELYDPPEDYNKFNQQYVPLIDDSRCYSRSEFWESNQTNNIINLMDYGPTPFVVNIEDATEQNNNFRTTLWTGNHLQITLMSIEVGSDIGLEVHPDTDQFIRVEDGSGIVKMGSDQNNLDFETMVYSDFAIMVPAGTWHNIINTGAKPLKVYSIYAPPHHPHSTVHRTKSESEAAEEKNHSINNDDLVSSNKIRNYW